MAPVSLTLGWLQQPLSCLIAGVCSLFLGCVCWVVGKGRSVSLQKVKMFSFLLFVPFSVSHILILLAESFMELQELLNKNCSKRT